MQSELTIRLTPDEVKDAVIEYIDNVRGTGSEKYDVTGFWTDGKSDDGLMFKTLGVRLMEKESKPAPKKGG